MSTNAPGFLFAETAARRTVAAVRAVEGEPLDLTDQPTERSLKAGDEVWVTITGTIAGGGHYEGKILLKPTADITPGSNAAVGDFGTAHTPAYGKLYITNAVEIGKNTHAIENGRVCRGTVLRRQTDGTVWVGIESFGIYNCATS